MEPAPKEVRKIRPADLVGRASAGKHSSNASGCIPDNIPVPKVLQLNALSASSGTPSSHSRDSFKPIPPMIMRTTPTANVAHCSATFPSCMPLKAWTIGEQRLRSSRLVPRSTCPRTCPDPQKTPVRKAFPGPALEFFSASGAKAARWSGPLSVWKAPAPAPDQAATRGSVDREETLRATVPKEEARASKWPVATRASHRPPPSASAPITLCRILRSVSCPGSADMNSCLPKSCSLVLDSQVIRVLDRMPVNDCLTCGVSSAVNTKVLAAIAAMATAATRTRRRPMAGESSRQAREPA
mmetsp:Transcript_74756/g.178408  ORF Transcript_74756/g.178408 Transcript_74756/m.178408 type:complete len:298 (+) Transcript_74756:176-1069(+)